LHEKRNIDNSQEGIKVELSKMSSTRRYLFIKPGFELGLEPGLDSGLEAKMTSGDFDGWKFIDSALTFKDSVNLDYSFTNNSKCLRNLTEFEELFIDNLRNVWQMGSERT
jgi:hypothetical protein